MVARTHSGVIHYMYNATEEEVMPYFEQTEKFMRKMIELMTLL